MIDLDIMPVDRKACLTARHLKKCMMTILNINLFARSGFFAA